LPAHAGRSAGPPGLPVQWGSTGPEGVQSPPIRRLAGVRAAHGNAHRGLGPCLGFCWFFASMWVRVGSYPALDKGFIWWRGLQVAAPLTFPVGGGGLLFPLGDSSCPARLSGSSQGCTPASAWVPGLWAVCGFATEGGGGTSGLPHPHPAWSGRW
jgi:hypothetical protein